MIKWLEDRLYAIYKTIWPGPAAAQEMMADLVARQEGHPPAEDPPVPPARPVLSTEEIGELIMERQRDKMIVLKGQLFDYVEFRRTHCSPFGSNGKLVELLTYMPDNFHIHMDYVPVPSPHFPMHEEDIQTPGDWVEDIDTCNRLAGSMEDQIEKIAMVIKVAGEDHPIQFITCNDEPIPLIKLYTDLSWVDAGWEGPAVIPRMHGDFRYPTAIAIIPDTTEIITLQKAFKEIEDFRLEKLPAFFDNHSATKRFKKAYDAFTSFLDRKAITYR